MSREWTMADWEALAAAGYHCEIREDGCVYRPAEQWIDGHPACEPCMKALKSKREE